MDREPRAGDVQQARVDHQVDAPLLELPRELPQRLARQLRVGDDRHHVRLAGLHRPEDGAEPAAVRAVRVDAHRPKPLDAAGAQPVEEGARVGVGADDQHVLHAEPAGAQPRDRLAQRGADDGGGDERQRHDDEDVAAGDVPLHRERQHRHRDEEEEAGLPEAPVLLGAAAEVALLVAALDGEQQHPEDRDGERERDVALVVPAAEARHGGDGRADRGGRGVAGEGGALVAHHQVAGVDGAAWCGDGGGRRVGGAGRARGALDGQAVGLATQVDVGVELWCGRSGHVRQLEAVHGPFFNGHQIPLGSAPRHGASRRRPPARLAVSASGQAFGRARSAATERGVLVTLRRCLRRDEQPTTDRRMPASALGKESVTAGEQSTVRRGWCLIENRFDGQPDVRTLWAGEWAEREGADRSG